jgi:hypothetical protein
MKAKIFFIALLMPAFISAQVYLTENFNSGIPAGWMISSPQCWSSSGDTIVWTATTNGWRGQGLAGFSLDSTEFVVVDSDLPSVFCECNEFLTSPVLNTSAASTLFLDFDQYFRYYTGNFAEIGEVQVYDGVAWLTVASYTATSGAWMAPSHQSINIMPYINASMQIRFRYNANWDWFWALDNISVAENPVLAAGTVSDDNSTIVYPNPAKNQITVESSQSKVQCMEVYDVLGQHVFSQPQTSDLKPQTTIDISQWKAGIYFIKVQAGEKVAVKKVVKM